MRPEPEPLLVPARAAFARIGVSVSLGYRLIRDGKLVAVKLRRKTMVTSNSLHELVASLPPLGPYCTSPAVEPRAAA